MIRDWNSISTHIHTHARAHTHARTHKIRKLDEETSKHRRVKKEETKVCAHEVLISRKQETHL